MIKRAKPKIELDLEKGLSRLWKELSRDFSYMINFLLFYKKPRNKFEYFLHVFEVACFYIILQFAVRGMFGSGY